MGELIKTTSDDARIYIDRMLEQYTVSVSITNHVKVLYATDSYIEARVFAETLE